MEDTCVVVVVVVLVRCVKCVLGLMRGLECEVRAREVCACGVVGDAIEIVLGRVVCFRGCRTRWQTRSELLVVVKARWKGRFKRDHTRRWLKAHDQGSANVYVIGASVACAGGI